MMRSLRRFLSFKPSSSKRRTEKPHAHLQARSRPLRCECLEDRRLLAITVDTLVDETDGSIVDGDISLRDALAVAEPGETIAFDISLDGGTILLTLGELAITTPLSVDATALAGGLTIDASGNDPTPGEGLGDGSRVFNIDDGDLFSTVDVTLRGLTLTGGDVTGDGGAIRSTERLTIVDSTISDNWAGDRESNDRHVSGGGIWTSTDIEIDSSLISNNSVEGGLFRWGGGIYTSGSATITASTITNNGAGIGGGIQAEGNIVLIDTLVSENSADSGAGVSAESVTVTASTISDNVAGDGDGGGIRAEEVVLVDSFISGNSTEGRGGGIFSRGSVTVTSSVISNNVAGGWGGGIHARGLSVTVTDSTISDNISAGNGGGIFSSSFVVIDRSTVSNNVAFNGGGTYASGRGATITSSTFLDNLATHVGGGIRAKGRLTVTASTFSGNQAGAIDADYVTLTSSTIADNRAVFGGGIYAGGGTIKLSTISRNTATRSGGGIWGERGSTAFTIVKSIVAGNIDGGTAPDLTGAISMRFSLIGDNTVSGLAEAPIGMLDADGNLIGDPDGQGIIDPLLGPLSDNGGPTATMALLAGSPAIDAGSPNVSPLFEFDQRGAPYARISAGRIDIGAFERQTLVVDTLVDETDGDFSDGDLSLREALEIAGSDPVIEAITFDPTLDGGTILLTQGELAITASLAIDASALNSGLRIDASGNDPTPAWGDGSRVLNIDDGDPDRVLAVEIRGLTLTGGDTPANGGAVRTVEDLTVADSRIIGNWAGAGGGLAASPGSRRTRIVRSTVSGNRAVGQGGGIRALGSTLSIIESVVSDNETTGDSTGGGIFSYAANVTITDSSIVGNRSQVAGGGIDALTNLGALTIWRSDISGNSPAEGGGLRIDGNGSAELRESTISGNSATNGGGLRLMGERDDSVILFEVTISKNRASGSGGGISTFFPVSLTASTISDNSAGLWGGGIFSQDDVVLTETSILGNSADDDGGGVYTLGSARVTSSIISDNVAGGRGGGVSAKYLNFVASTLSGNVATTAGGAYAWRADVLGSTVSRNAAKGGGGIVVFFDVSVTSSTFTENVAEGSGGAIFGSATISFSTISDNSAAQGGGLWHWRADAFVIDHSIVAGNTDDGTAPDLNGVASVDFSLIGDNTGSGLAEAPVGMPDADGNFIGDPNGQGIIDPHLGPLADNGGPTKTRALLFGSPAIDVGDPLAVPGEEEIPNFDQRGEPFGRVERGGANGPRIDVGAYEVQRPRLLGDMDFDGDVDYDDIAAFVVGLNDPAAYVERYGARPSFNGDIDIDGDQDYDDIDGFVALLPERPGDDAVAGVVSSGVATTTVGKGQRRMARDSELSAVWSEEVDWRREKTMGTDHP
ncbi:MAG: choice-of-anchor Q domain-containing protein [Pirellulales bacterium]